MTAHQSSDTNTTRATAGVQDSAPASDTGLDVPTHEQIAVRAYECWQRRGGIEGSAEDDWRQAEEELRAEKKPAVAKSRSAAAGS